MILVVVHYHFKKGQGEAFFNAVTSEGIDKMSQAEDGNFLYELARPVGDPDTGLLVEKWESAEALAKHGTQPHYLRLGEIKNLYVENTEVEKFNV